MSNLLEEIQEEQAIAINICKMLINSLILLIKMYKYRKNSLLGQAAIEITRKMMKEYCHLQKKMLFKIMNSCFMGLSIEMMKKKSLKLIFLEAPNNL